MLEVLVREISEGAEVKALGPCDDGGKGGRRKKAQAKSDGSGETDEPIMPPDPSPGTKVKN